MTENNRKYVKQAFKEFNDIIRLSNVEDAWEPLYGGVRALVTVHVRTPITLTFEANGETWTETMKMGKHKLLVFVREPYVPHPVEGRRYASLVDVEAIYS